MLVTFLCIMGKILEFSSGHMIESANQRRNRKCRRVPGVGNKGMTEEGLHPPGVITPESDCNSNHTNNGISRSFISNASSQDMDFIQDNSDYLWCLDDSDSRYRDQTTHSYHPVAVLSVSQDGGYYENLARNLDANLAEVDMEDFRSEDIHSILNTLPAMYCGDAQPERLGEMFASVSGSMMAKFEFDSSISPHSSSRAEVSGGSSDTMSICKSEPLFSPVKECPLPNSNFSVDSLDCDLLTEHDIMLTCQANKDNYTIAFEGSLTLYSEDSDYHEAGESQTTSEGNNWSSGQFTHGGRSVGNRHLDTSMARSDSVYTTWSKLKKRSSEVQLTRHPSGNNNCTTPDNLTLMRTSQIAALKSQSLPNLHKHRRRCLLASLHKVNTSIELDTNRLGGCIKLYDVQHRNSGSFLSDANSSSTCSGGIRKIPQPPNFNLVKLFMKQKSVSNEGMCMDHSSASECWPPSNNSQSDGGDSDSYGSRPQQRNNMINLACQRTLAEREFNNGNACCRMNNCICPEDDKTDTTCDNDPRKRLTTSLYDSTDNGNEQKFPPTNVKTNNWIKPEETTTVYSTCCFEDSLVQPTRKDDSYNQSNDLIEEEDEDRSSGHSESVEQLSESVSKIDESTVDLAGSSCNSCDQCSLSSQNVTTKIAKPKTVSGVSNGVSRASPKFNVNNNNSFESEQIHSPIHKKYQTGQVQYTPTKRFNCHHSHTSTGESISSLSSETDVSKAQTTTSPGANLKNNSTQVPLYLMNRSIQTSGFADVKNWKPAPYHLLESPNGTSVVKVIEPSVEPKSGFGKLLGDNVKKPMYIFYPNYALPDLQFLREKRKDLDVSKIFLMPQQYTKKEKDASDNPESASAQAPKVSVKAPRPFSLNDIEALKKKGFSHIRDWESLTFLLPREYKKILADVPEVVHHLKEQEEDHAKPLFCISPPLRKSRPASCDCASLIAGTDCKNNVTNVSSSSSTATQPSSGFRGSSTILSTDSSCNPVPSSTYNPLFVYRYDSVSSESSIMSSKQPAGSAGSIPKRSVSLPSGNSCKRPVLRRGESCGGTPPRPPLPRGILRKSFDTSTPKYNCKVHKNDANSKRYSMFELGRDGEEAVYDNEVKSNNHRRSFQNDFGCMPHQKGLFKKNVEQFDETSSKTCRKPYPEKDVDEMEDDDFDEGVDAGTDSSFEEGNSFQMRPPTPPLPKTPDNEATCLAENENIVKFEKFLEVSGLSVVCSDEDMKVWDDDQMKKLRLQVSKFLLNNPGNREIPDCHTPNNTPEHKNMTCDCVQNAKKTVSFAEKICFSQKEAENICPHGTQTGIFQDKANLPLQDLPIREEGESSPECGHSPASNSPKRHVVSSQTLLSTEVSVKRELVTTVSDVVEQLISHFSVAENSIHCSQLGDSAQTPGIARMILGQLCPALYVILSDGLKPSLETAFGTINNSVWQVVEASAQQGPMTKALNDLVIKLNTEDVMTEGLMKFNSFVFGLLNVRSLDAWVNYLRTRESILRKHYLPESLLVLSNTGGAAMRGLMDQLVASLQPLALLPFHLDLLFECRELHESLQRLGSFAGQTSPTPEPVGKPWNLRKIVRSIQSSLSQSNEEEPAWFQRKSVQSEHGRKSSLEDESSSNLNQAEKSRGSPSSPLPDLVDSSKFRYTEGKQRPRSCVDSTASSNTSGFSLVTDLASTVKKRWSGIHFGSKLFQAFDRLGMEDTEEEYTDSLENYPKNNRVEVLKQKDSSGSSNNSTSDDCPEISKSETPSPLPEHKEKKDNKTIQKTENDKRPVSNGGLKFRRLQMQWEMLSGKEGKDPNTKSSPVTSPEKNPVPNSGARSKIPRLVTSPVKAGGSISPLQAGKKGPLTPTGGTQLRRPVTSNIGRPKSTPVSPENQEVVKTGAIKKAAGRTSRLDQIQEPTAVRPSSLPYRTPSALRSAQTRKPEVQRRAASSSLNRQRHTDNQPLPRFVRTLFHRLPSDSGHLAFNEGERLRVVLEVDSKWLLCCRGEQKGLVPRTAVIALTDKF